MEINLDSFKIADFLAYLLPGATGLAGAWAIYLVWAGPDPFVPPSNLLSAFIAFALAYVLGTMSSALSPLRGWGDDPTGDPDHHYELAIDCTSTLIAFLEAYEKLTGEEIKANDWNKDRFFLCRSILRQLPVEGWAFAFRQSLIRQLRYNSALPVLLWSTAGLSLAYQRHATSALQAIIIAVVVIILTLLVLRGLARAGAGNIRRENREVCLALLAYTMLKGK